MAALATPYTAILGLSLLSTSHALFSQLSGKLYGTPQIIDKAEDRKAAGLSPEGALALWNMWFEKVTVSGHPCLVFTVIELSEILCSLRWCLQ